MGENISENVNNNLDLKAQFEKIGIKEMAKKTYIIESHIHDIINKNFDRIQPSKGHGFIKIIEKEYKLDLSAWVKEYDEYLKKNKSEELIEALETPKKEEPTPKQAPKIKKSINFNFNKFFKVLLLVIALIGAFIAWFFNYSKDIQFKSVSEVSDNPKVVKELVQEAKTNLENVKEINNSELKIIYADENDTKSLESNETNISEVNNTTPPIPEVVVPKELYILPKYKIWAGIIYLDNRKKKTFTTKKKIELDPKRDQLIALGHKEVKLFFNGERVKNLKESARFLYKDGNLSTLTFKEFKKLNRGRNW